MCFGHPTRLSTLPTTPGAAGAGNTSLTFAGIRNLAAWRLLCPLSPLWGSGNLPGIIQRKQHSGHSLCFPVQAESTVGKIIPRKKIGISKKNFDISESGLVVSRKQEEQHCPNPERSWVHFSAEFPKETWNEPPCLCIPTIPEACLAFTQRCVRLSHGQSPKPFLGVSCATPSLSLHGNTKSCSHKEPPEMSQPQTTTRACICSGKQENPSPSCNSTAAGAPQAPPQQTPQFSPKLCPATSGVHFQSSIPLLQGPFSALSPSARAGGRL